MSTSLFFPVVLLCVAKAVGFYLPGKAPVSFCENVNETNGCKVEAQIYVNRLNSDRTVMPYEYEEFDFCAAPAEVKPPDENFGQVLLGDRIRPSPYKLKFNKNKFCQEVCVKHYTAGDLDSKQKLSFLKQAILLNYKQYWILDDMPVTWCYNVEGGGPPVCVRGFPIGCYVTKDGIKKDTCLIYSGMTESDTFYLYNHVNITVKYHRSEDTPFLSKITSARLIPRSIKYSDNCVQGGGHMAIKGEEMKDNITVRYTYSVRWEEDREQEWASRWDYILETPHTSISWFSVVNSGVVILFLSGALIACMVRALKGNVAQSNQKKDSDDGLGKYEKWKLLHGDVFRPPRCGMLLAALNGSGIQILFMSAITIQFACFGFLSPANRGALPECALILCSLSGFPAGVASARVYRRFHGDKWKTTAALTALLCPGIVFIMFLILNTALWIPGSSGAVPFTTILILLGLWLGVSLPLTFIGACLGYKKGKLSHTEKINEVPRPVPSRSIIYKTVPGMIIGGILPFGVIFIQNFFVLLSIWKYQVFYTYDILLLVFILLLITCTESTILLCYFHLIAQDYHWWWRSFLTSGFTAVYFFIYSIHFYVTKLDLDGGTSAFLYFGYMLMISFMLFLLTGCVGFFACLLFIKKMYSVVK